MFLSYLLTSGEMESCSFDFQIKEMFAFLSPLLLPFCFPPPLRRLPPLSCSLTFQPASFSFYSTIAPISNTNTAANAPELLLPH